jgi:hypothetical protein
LSLILNILQQAEQSETNIAEIKTKIKNNYPEIYNELQLASKNSLVEMSFAIEKTKSTLEQSKSQIIIDIRTKLDLLVFQNKNEVAEKDRHKKTMLEFLNSIGFDAIPQSKTKILIDYLNKYP